MNVQANKDTQQVYSQINEIDSEIEDQTKQEGKIVPNSIRKLNFLKIQEEADFIKGNVDLMVEDEEETNIKRLYLEDACFSDPKDIFTGKRSPFVVDKIIEHRESNVISPGQMIEYKYALFFGCKDGTIRVLKFSDKNSKTIKKRWIPHNDLEVQRMISYENYLFTLAQGTFELKAWDIEGWIKKKDQNPPDCLFTLKQVFSFDIRPYQENIVFYCCRENIIECRKVNNLSKQEDMQNVFWDTELPKQCDWIAQSNANKDGLDIGIVFLIGNDIIRRIYSDEKQYQDNIIMTKPVSLQVKGFFIDECTLTITFDDISNNDIVIWFINLNVMDEVLLQEEEKKIEKEKKKQMFEEEQKRLQIELGPLYKNPQIQEELEEQEEDPVSKYRTVISFDSQLGSCMGVYESINHESRFIVSGINGFAIIDQQQVLFTVSTQFKNTMCIFSADDNYVIMIGTDGIVRYLDWTPDLTKPKQKLPYDQVEDVISTNSNDIFAVISHNHTQLSVYNYREMKEITKLKFSHMENFYLMNFTANNKVLLICCASLNPEYEKIREVQDTENTYFYQITAISLDDTPGDQDWTLPFYIKLENVYPYQIDASIEKKKIYIVSQNSFGQCQLNIFAIGQSKSRYFQKNISAVAVSPCQNLLAFVDTSGTIFMHYIEYQEQINEIKTNEEINTITFFQFSKKVLVSSKEKIWAYDYVTHDVVYSLQHPVANLTFGRVRLQNDMFVYFIDPNAQFCIYDIEAKEHRGLTKKLKKIDYKHHPSFDQTNHYAGCLVGNHGLFQMDDTNKLEYQKNPFQNEGYTGDDSLTSHFQEINGFFIPILMGGPHMNTGTFGDIYTNAYINAVEDNNSTDIQSLQTIIYPFRLTALHYFVIDIKPEALAFCFRKEVIWMNDVFGKSPLDYALEIGNRSILETIVEGLYNMEADQRQNIMRSIPLNSLLQNSTVFLSALLREAGYSEPQESKMCKGAKLPKIFPLQALTFCDGSNVYYDLKIQSVLHPPENLKLELRRRAVSTSVMNNPVPNHSTENSLELLQFIGECKSDEVVRSKPITIYLNRKWNQFGYQFYLVNMIVFTIHLLVTCFITYFQPVNDESSHVTPEESQWKLISLYIILAIALITNSYFFLYEFLQIYIQKFNYFLDIQNLCDITRITMIYMLIFEAFRPDVFPLPSGFFPMISIFMWYKYLTYLKIFKATRYLIYMIFEIINDIKPFLIIFFTSLFAYAQISFALQGNIDETDPSYVSFGTNLRSSYGFAFGDLPSYQTTSSMSFLVFFIFAFFIPLVLLNMLIAIMGDSYARVQANAIAADARSLAQLELEMEELTNFLYKKFKPNSLNDAYYYCFSTKIDDGDDDGDDWEGVVGQLKNVIAEQLETLEGKINQMVKESIKLINISNTLGETNLKGIQQSKEMIEDTQKQITDETKGVKTALDDSTSKTIEFIDDKTKNTWDLFNTKNKETTHLIDTECRKISSKIYETSEKQIKIQMQNFDALSEANEMQKKALKETSAQIDKNIEISQENTLGLSKVDSNIHSYQKIQKEAMDYNLQKMDESFKKVRDKVRKQSIRIEDGVTQSTSKIIQNVDETSNKGIEKIQKEAKEQSGYHSEVVNLAQKQQDKVNQLLDENLNHQKIILERVNASNLATIVKAQTEAIKQELDQKIHELGQEQSNQIRILTDNQKNQGSQMQLELSRVIGELQKIIDQGRDTIMNQKQYESQFNDQHLKLIKNQEEIIFKEQEIMNKEIEILEKEHKILEQNTEFEQSQKDLIKEIKAGKEEEKEEAKNERKGSELKRQNQIR